MKENFKRKEIQFIYIEWYYMRLHLLSKQDYYNFQEKYL